MRQSSTRDVALIPFLLPIVGIGLFPLVMLPLLGYLGFVVLGVLTGFAAIMAELEEPQAHAQHLISHGAFSRSEQAGYFFELDSLHRSLWAVKIVSAALIAIGVGGFMLTA